MARDSSSRFLDVFELARARSAVCGRVPLSELTRLAASLSGSEGDLAYEVQGQVDGRGRPAARVRLCGTLRLVCDRCGNALPFELDAAAHFYFVHSEQELARIPVEDSPEEPLLGSTRFDLLALIEDEAILALPISPRHLTCEGEAASATAASDEASERPHPFAALAQLRPRRQ